MSAIFGFIGPRQPGLAGSLSGLIQHRGPISETFEETEGATLGYRESQHHPSPGTGIICQGGMMLAISGQLTQLPEAQEGEASGLEAILATYRRRGSAFLSELKGSFVLALYDGRNLLLARDGAGQRTIYYSNIADRLVFSIEPKGIWQLPGFARSLRPGAVLEYLTFSFIPGGGTMLSGLQELPAGHLLRAESGLEPHLERYFCFEQQDREQVDADTDWAQAFRQGLAGAVERRLPAGEPVGVFLSGGLDSSVVTAELARQMPQKPKSWSIHFGKNYPNELAYAAQVAEFCGTDHQEVKIQPKDFLPRLREILWYLDEPIGDPITVPNYELARHVSGEVQCIFNGEGGDPCFGGPKNIPMLMNHWYGGVPRDDLFRERAYLESYRRCYSDLYNLLDPDFVRELDVDKHLTGHLTPLFEAPYPKGFLDKLTMINVRLKGAHLILPKVERMMSAHNIAPQSPLFDEALLELSFRMPAAQRLQGGIEKVVMKQAYRGRLPDAVIDRPKSGMRVPVHFWFQREMRRYAKQLLHPKRIRQAGIFNPHRVKQLLDYDIEEGQGRYGIRLWMLLTFELWRQMVIEGQ